VWESEEEGNMIEIEEFGAKKEKSWTRS